MNKLFHCTDSGKTLSITHPLCIEVYVTKRSVQSIKCLTSDEIIQEHVLKITKPFEDKFPALL